MFRILTRRANNFPERINTSSDETPFAEVVMHENRYLLSKKLILDEKKGSFTILDAGCGTGYGSAVLASIPGSMIEGVDIDSDSISQNIKKYANQKNLTFRQTDLTKIDTDGKKYDFITCFEVIEHIDISSGEKLMKNFYKLLKPGGKLMISSPNFSMSENLYRLKISSPNPFHIHEYRVAELKSKLAKSGFSSLKVFGQFIFFPPLYFLSKPSFRLDSFFKPYDFLPTSLCRYFFIEARKS